MEKLKNWWQTMLVVIGRRTRPNWGLVAFADGSRYIGGIKNGILHGYGTMTLASGEEYCGVFHNGRLVEWDIARRN